MLEGVKDLEDVGGVCGCVVEGVQGISNGTSLAGGGARRRRFFGGGAGQQVSRHQVLLEALQVPWSREWSVSTLGPTPPPLTQSTHLQEAVLQHAPVVAHPLVAVAHLSTSGQEGAC